jgi:hypothetical protein
VKNYFIPFHICFTILALLFKALSLFVIDSLLMWRYTVVSILPVKELADGAIVAPARTPAAFRKLRRERLMLFLLSLKL